MISTLAANDNIAFVGHDPTHAPDGYYLARALGPAYELDADTDLAELLDESGKPTHLPKGSRVVDAWYYNMVPGKAGWYAPYEAGNAAGRVRVPSHMILGAGFDMPAAVAPAPPKKASGKYTAKDALRAWVAKGAVVLSEKVEELVRDNLDRRDE